MSDHIEIDEETKQFVYDILSKNNFNSTSEIKYISGSQVGDGYGSKTIAVDVKDGERSLHLFLKCALNVFRHESFDKIYATEILLYTTIIPTYQKFSTDKSIDYGFSNAPKCYGVYEKAGSEIIALENLRKKNFTLFDKSKYMNDKHLELIFQTFAKLHAISFAMKDQQRDIHDKFCEDHPNIFVGLRVLGMANVVGNMAKEFVEKLDKNEDEDIIRRCNDLASKIEDQLMNMDKYLNEYSILTKGDCWVNNMMLLYQDEIGEDLVDVMLIDWQGVTRGSPVHDLGGIFYSVSSKETVNNYKYYLKMYYTELSKRIKELGSDPEVLYPFSVLETDWKKYALYSFGGALLMVKMMLCKKENAPLLKEETARSEAAETMERMFKNVNDGEEQFLRRMKYISRHLIEIGAL